MSSFSVIRFSGVCYPLQRLQTLQFGDLYESEGVQTLDPDFVPTPAPIARQLMELADIHPGMRVLEPSAGKGNIAKELQTLPIDLSVIELNPKLQQQLRAEGLNVVSDDFLRHHQRYDRILMNPPFSKYQAIQHIQHAYDLLKPGGKVIAIFPNYLFSNGRPKPVNFQQWVYSISKGMPETFILDKRVFQNDESNVNVKTRVLVLSKPS